MNLRFWYRRLAVLAALALTLNACSDEEVLAGGDEDPEPAGLTFTVDGQTVTIDGTTVTGSVTVSVNAETSDFTVVFLDESGAPITIDTDEFFVDGEAESELVAEFHATTKLGGHIEGHSVGATTMTFHLMHPPADPHSHWASAAVPVEVVP